MDAERDVRFATNHPQCVLCPRAVTDVTAPRLAQDYGNMFAESLFRGREARKVTSMMVLSIRGKVAVGAIAAAAIGMTAGGVALASAPAVTNGPAVAVPHVFFSSHRGAVEVPFFKTATMGHLSLPAGVYTVSAKAWMQSQAGTGNSSVRCALTVGGSSDQSQADAQDGNAPTGPEPVRNEVLYLSVSGILRHPTVANLTCRNFGGGFTVLQFTNITAIKVSGLTKSTF